MDISFYCYKCGQHIVIDEAGAGVQVECPTCRITLTVPQTRSQPATPPPLPVLAPPVIVKPIPTASAKDSRTWKIGAAVAAAVIIGVVLIVFVTNSSSPTSTDTGSAPKVTHQEAYDLGYKAGVTDAVYPADANTHSDSERETQAQRVATGIYQVESGQVDQWVASFMTGYNKAIAEYSDPSSRALILGMKAGMDMCAQGAVKPSDDVLDAMARQAVGAGDSYMWKIGFRQGWSAQHGL